MLGDILNKEKLHGNNDSINNNNDNDDSDDNIVSSKVRNVDFSNDKSIVSDKIEEAKEPEISELPELIYQITSYLTAKVHNLLFFARYYCDDEKLYNQMIKRKEIYDKNIIKIAPTLFLKFVSSPYAIIPSLIIEDVAKVRYKISIQNISQKSLLTGEETEKKDIKYDEEKNKVLTPEDFKKLLFN